MPVERTAAISGPAGAERYTYTGERLLQIAMPLGGIGAGCICLNGYGGLQDFSIRHRPQLSAAPDQHLHHEAAFALLREKASNRTRLLEGPFPIHKIYDQGLRAQGYWGGGHEGLPRFRECTFHGEYPFGSVQLSEPGFPLQAQVTGFNPFIPLDVKNSAIPCVILEYRLVNASPAPVEYEFSYHLSHLAPGKDVKKASSSRNEAIPGEGVFFFNQEDPACEEFGSACLLAVGRAAGVKTMWLRGAWVDALSALWHEVSTGTFQPNDGLNPAGLTGRNGGSLLFEGRLASGESILYPLVIAWHFPNVNLRSGGAQAAPAGCGCAGQTASPAWRPYYVNHWSDARQVAEYVSENYAELRRRTQAFHDAVFGSSLPDEVLEAVSANLAILKSPTVLLQENGNLWGWEGCFAERGCCPGSCTHVWNYAQSLPHLFPQLERTLREQELEGSMDERGHVNFRSALPDGPCEHNFYAAADGQLGGVMKVHREWQISGDQGWLEKMYPLVKRSLDYCIETWDPHRAGVLEEPHHNTYDIEFWGPDGMCSSIYTGALVAMAALARACDHPEDAARYEVLARRGAQFLDEELFNGEYYQQQTQPAGQNLKYQYGPGCLSDGIIGAWMAHMCGLELPLDADHIRSSLQSIYRYNFKRSLWEHANPQRPGYALGDEPGLLLCTWPRGGRPVLPFIYSDEVWTGIEHQVASHLISQGFVEQGLQIVQAARTRYDGRVRNPWNEYECGSHYARAMSSYALLLAFSGIGYSAVTKTLRVAPQVQPPEFRSFFSTASGWGQLVLDRERLEIRLQEGSLRVDELEVTWAGKTRRLQPRMMVKAGAPATIPLG